MKKYYEDIMAIVIVILLFVFGSVVGVILDRGGDYPLLKHEEDYRTELTLTQEDGWEQVDVPIWTVSGRVHEYGGWFDPELGIGYNDHDGYYVLYRIATVEREDGTSYQYPWYWTNASKNSLTAWLTEGENGLWRNFIAERESATNAG